MKIEVLLSVMNQSDHSFLKKMNIKTDAVVVNQANFDRDENFTHDGKHIHMISMNKRGVGLSRNTALENSSAEIILFADQDVEYADNYHRIIKSEFKNNPKADIIIFNLKSKNPKNPTYMITKDKRVRRYSSLRYGATKIAARRENIVSSGVKFSLLFGGGAKYSAGEDSLFLYSCIKQGLKVYACSKQIGTVDQLESTWFTGYNNKFFHDKGAFFYTLSPRLYPILVAQFILRKRGYKSSKSWSKMLQLMNEGREDARK